MNKGAVSEPYPPSAAVLRDFPDRLPPVLVKELRQGMRTRMFVIPFLVLHLLLVISSAESRGGTGLFWTCLVLMLVALLPMRNTAALSEERQANTLDTLVLTKLTPWRIVWGKWSATFALVLLTAVSALPYLLVRYLNGGSSFVQEGAVLAGVVLVSGALTAVLTALSALHSALTRNIFAVMLIAIAWQFGCTPLLRSLELNAAGFGPVPVILLTGCWAVMYFLCHAASAIAPAALNLTAPRRLITAGAAGIAGLLSLLSDGTSRHGAERLLVAIAVVTSMVEMGDRPSWHPGIGAAFARRGLPGRLAAQFLHPGWATGVAFCSGLWLWTHFLQPDSRIAGVAALCFLPILMGAPLLARQRSGTVVMILGALIVSLLGSIVSTRDLHDFLPFSMLLPNVVSPGNFQPVLAVVYGLAALALATPSLIGLQRRISGNPACNRTD